jgi:hypothetical protein
LMYFAALDASHADLLSLEIVPLQIRNFQFVQPTRPDIEWLQQRLDRESGRFGARVVLAAEGRLVVVRALPQSRRTVGEP